MNSVFGFASLFNVLLRYGIYASRCEILSEEIISNDTVTVTADCRAQIQEYQVRWMFSNAVHSKHSCISAGVCPWHRLLQFTGRCSRYHRWLFRTAIPEDNWRVRGSISDTVYSECLFLFSMFHLISWLSLGFVAPGEKFHFSKTSISCRIRRWLANPITYHLFIPGRNVYFTLLTFHRSEFHSTARFGHVSHRSHVSKSLAVLSLS